VELWRSDGTAAGSEPILRFCDSDGYPINLRYLTPAGSRLFFFVKESVYTDWGTDERVTLWVSNGTASGTVSVKDLGYESPLPPLVLGETLFFPLERGWDSASLWRSDGTEAGTSPVADIKFSAVWSPVTVDGVSVLFVGNDGQTGNELWRTDGAPETTALVRDIMLGPTGSISSDLTVIGNRVFFFANDGDHGRELWVSDGTWSGTHLVKDFIPGSADSFDIWTSAPFGADLHGDLVLLAPAPGQDTYYSLIREVWRTAGTETGTLRLTHVSDSPGVEEFHELASVGNAVFFTTQHFPQLPDGPYPEYLWYSDGTVGSERVVTQFLHESFSSQLAVFRGSAQDLLFFTVDDSVHGQELWRSNGTADGTMLLEDIHAATAGSRPRSLFTLADSLFFVANDGGSGYELWRSNGTKNGTQLVKDINPGPANAFSPPKCNEPTPSCDQTEEDEGYGELIPAGGFLFFPALVDGFGYELWRTDGTEAGTILVKDIASGTMSSYPSHGVGVGHTYYFAASEDGESNSQNRKLWKSDGTEAGTVSLHDPLSGGPFLKPTSLTSFGGTLFFVTQEGLWQTDKITNSATLIKAGAGIINLTAVDESLFFSIRESGGAVTWWRSDGTEFGTAMLHRFESTGTGALPPADLTSSGGMLFFTAGYTDRKGEHRSLWRSDATDMGTVKVVSTPPSLTETPKWLFDLNGTLLFSGYHSALGWELCRVAGDGPAQLVKDICVGANGSNPQSLSVLGRKLLFSADDGTTGRELWASDGTEEGTKQLRDITPGTGDFEPAYLGSIGEKVLFRTTDEIHGEEPWMTGGTADGTVLLQDIAAGPASSKPSRLVTAGRHLFFAANRADVGRELFAVPLAAFGHGCAGDCDRSGDVSVAELIRAVNIALGALPAAQCATADTNSDDVITIAELITAVNNALHGCVSEIGPSEQSEEQRTSTQTRP
jgi:large repetitive protein